MTCPAHVETLESKSQGEEEPVGQEGQQASLCWEGPGQGLGETRWRLTSGSSQTPSPQWGRISIETKMWFPISDSV